METVTFALNLRITHDMKESRRKDMIMGCLVGLAVGDAYGTTWEFTNKFQMPSEDELSDYIIGGGPFDLNPGDWTDDTSMALCLAESLIEKGRWDEPDQMQRYVDWWLNGHNSVKGECFDIGHSTRSALGWYNMTEGREYVTNPDGAGNGVLMRLAPIPMFFYDGEDAVLTLNCCVRESMMTHPSSQSYQCSMLMGAIIDKIFSGERDKDKIVSFEYLDENSKAMYDELYEEYGCTENGRIELIKIAEYKDLGANKISGSGYCVHTLEAALWAFLSTDSFMAGLKRVVSLGDDTDTTGAVYGQIAGAYYGLSQIPHRDKLTWSEKIHGIAEKLYEMNAKRRQLDVLEIIESESGYVRGEKYDEGIYLGIIDTYPHNEDHFLRQHHFRVPTPDRGVPSIINTVLIKKIKREDV